MCVLGLGCVYVCVCVRVRVSVCACVSFCQGCHNKVQQTEVLKQWKCAVSGSGGGESGVEVSAGLVPSELVKEKYDRCPLLPRVDL